MKLKFQALVAIFAFAQFAAHAQPAQGTPGSGWSMDPSKQGMRDLRSVRPIEGCMAPGGLQRIISSDEPGSGAFWCGTPPYCLTQAAVPGNWHCTIVQYSRRDPRGDPNGRPGANPVRNPEDLRCVNTGNPPVNGQCPLPPPPPPPPPPGEPGEPGEPGVPPPDDQIPVGSQHSLFGARHGERCIGIYAVWHNPYSPPPTSLQGYRGSVVAGAARAVVVSPTQVRLETRFFGQFLGGSFRTVCTARMPAEGRIETCSTGVRLPYPGGITASIGVRNGAIVGNVVNHLPGDGSCHGR